MMNADTLYISFGNSYLANKLNYRRLTYHNHVHLFVTSHNPQNRVSMILHVMKNVEEVNIGKYSRGGKSREEEPEEASDHDMNPEIKMVPFGIFEPTTDHI
ncbi:MAG: hypothetical protein C5S48_02965 [Candidatus Methanogaster sp.]|nr:MAG: hypothetical protein C5S48_02965 [ANME-2 cluster archaeon]